MTMTKKMYKVLCPMERNGRKWWMRMGAAFPNRDESLNVYLDAIPTHTPFTLQIREMTEEDMRESAERRAARPANPAAITSGRADASFDPNVHSVESFNAKPQSVPF